MKFKPEPKLRTGLEQSIVRRGRDGALITVASPILSQNKRTFSFDGSFKPFDASRVRKGYYVDGAIRQSQEKYIELILRNGFKLEGDTEPLSYVKRRLELMGEMSDPPAHFPIVLEALVREFVVYANAFLIKGRAKSIPLRGTRGLDGKDPVGALFPVSAPQVEPAFADKNPDKQIGWRQMVKSTGGPIKWKDFGFDEVIHFAYCREPGGIFGIPTIVSAIEDVESLRKIEEHVLALTFKHLNPLIHTTVPALGPNGTVRAEDIDLARSALSQVDDGVLITPVGFEVNLVGAESQAVRAEGYLKAFKSRVFADLAVSPLVMGEAESLGAGTADALTAQLITKAKHYQNLLALYITLYIVNPLLQEGGYDPIFKEDDRVYFVWPEVDFERTVKHEAHLITLWTNDLITYSEMRHALGYPAEVDPRQLYSHVVSIPRSVGTKLGIDPLDLTKEEILSMTQASNTRNKDSSPKDTTGSASSTANPQNQHSGGSE